MKSNKSVNFIFLIIAIILATAIYKEFDFENMKFEKPGIAVVYILTFLFSIFIIVRSYKKQPEK